MFGRKRKVAKAKTAKGRKQPLSREDLIARYLENGAEPWSKGYREYKMRLIGETLADPELVREIGRGQLPAGFAIGVDERSVEYPWAVAHLRDGEGPVLDAGSALNFEELAELPLWRRRPLTIAGLSVEKKCFYPLGISYQFCDLRDLPFRDGFFHDVACLSTLEHVGMDNSIYGHDNEQPNLDVASTELKSDAFLPAVRELCRVTGKTGRVLVTVPVGRYEHHGFFQQFDEPLIGLLKDELGRHGQVGEQYFRYEQSGWVACGWEECRDSRSHNPSSGTGKGDDGAAHCRAVGCFVAAGKP